MDAHEPPFGHVQARVNAGRPGLTVRADARPVPPRHGRSVHGHAEGKDYRRRPRLSAGCARGANDAAERSRNECRNRGLVHDNGRYRASNSMRSLPLRFRQSAWRRFRARERLGNAMTDTLNATSPRRTSGSGPCEKTGGELSTGDIMPRRHRVTERNPVDWAVNRRGPPLLREDSLQLE